MLEVMFSIPSRTDVKKVIITKETIEDGTSPELYNTEDQLINTEVTSA